MIIQRGSRLLARHHSVAIQPDDVTDSPILVATVVAAVGFEDSSDFMDVSRFYEMKIEPGFLGFLPIFIGIVSRHRDENHSFL